MKNKNWLWLIPIFVLGLVYASNTSGQSRSKAATEIRCKQIKWYIGSRLHKQKSDSYQYNDNTVRCENKEVICYIYHGQISCIKN